MSLLFYNYKNKLISKERCSFTLFKTPPLFQCFNIYSLFCLYLWFPFTTPTFASCFTYLSTSPLLLFDHVFSHWICKMTPCVQSFLIANLWHFFHCVPWAPVFYWVRYLWHVHLLHRRGGGLMQSAKQTLCDWLIIVTMEAPIWRFPVVSHLLGWEPTISGKHEPLNHVAEILDGI